MLVKASFIAPLLEASPSSLEFTVAKAGKENIGCVEKTVTLTNVSPLPLTALLACGAPFSLLCDQSVRLEPSSSADVVVRYNPNLRSDSFSRIDGSRLDIRFAEHPHEEFIALKATVSFPNVIISPESINFGCIVNNTTEHSRVVVRNNGSLPVKYSWSLLDDGKSASNATQLIDILPLEGHLEPGSSQTTEILFHGSPNCIVQVLAMCNVVDGPKYVIILCTSVHGSIHMHRSCISHKCIHMSHYDFRCIFFVLFL